MIHPATGAGFREQGRVLLGLCLPHLPSGGRSRILAAGVQGCTATSLLGTRRVEGSG